MESGLEDRNNGAVYIEGPVMAVRLNGVRPRRPEQFWANRYSPPVPTQSQWSPA